jgi:hypothetical protein
MIEGDGTQILASKKILIGPKTSWAEIHLTLNFDFGIISVTVFALY